MSTLVPLAPAPIEAPIPRGTNVVLDEAATFIDRELVSGGSPWRLLRLAGASHALAERWKNGGVVQAGEERFARTLVLQGLLRPHFSTELRIDEIDVVVPIFDKVAPLQSLLRQLQGFHVTVVDDGSPRGEEIRSCCESFGADLIRLDDNKGAARARNVGASTSKRKCLWFIDADLVMDNAFDVAQRLFPVFGDPLVAAAAPRVRGAAGSSIRERFEQHFGPLDMGERSGLVVPGGTIGYVPSASIMVRREAFGEGFDETLRVGEDVDFVWRLYDAGWLVRYEAEIVVTHPPRDTWRSWWLQRQRYGASSAELATRHGARLAPLRADPWTLLAWTSVLIGRPSVGARIIRSARAHARDQFFQETENPNEVAKQVVTRNMLRAGGPLARAAVRTFGVVLLVAALNPRLRNRALLLFATGTAWRWRHHRLHITDVPLAVADDLAYSVGVFQGAARLRTLTPMTPRVTKSSMALRDVLGFRASSDELEGVANGPDLSQ
ncbi:MAG TPA: mycofactocin biosynthesis glycosyltransferase MftF [Acidimicrobiales bacterium]|nr:mycofactocin biosynthesis glycosyltransferase MftF [Acidimicrobiales bacterium]